MLPEPNGKGKTWAIFVNNGNAIEWSKKHGGKLKIRPVEVSLKFTRPTKRALDGLRALRKSDSLSTPAATRK